MRRPSAVYLLTCPTHCTSLVTKVKEQLPLCTSKRGTDERRYGPGYSYVVTFMLRSPLTRGEERKAITERVAGWALLPIWKFGKLNQYFCPPRRCEEYLGPPACIIGTGCTTRFKTHRKTKTFSCCWTEPDLWKISLWTLLFLLTVSRLKSDDTFFMKPSCWRRFRRLVILSSPCF